MKKKKFSIFVKFDSPRHIFLAIRFTRRFFDYLPLNNRDNPPTRSTSDAVDRAEDSLDVIVPSDPNKPYDIREVVVKIVDDYDFLEVQPDFAKNIVIGFARMNGSTVGIVANNPMSMAGCLDIDASVKASRFVRFLDCFNIPIVTFVDVPGFLPGRAQVHPGSKQF